MFTGLETSYADCMRIDYGLVDAGVICRHRSDDRPLFTLRQFETIRLEGFTIGFEFTAATRILVALAAGFAGGRSKFWLGCGRLRKQNHRRPPAQRRCRNKSDDFRFHFLLISGVDAMFFLLIADATLKFIKTSAASSAMTLILIKAEVWLYEYRRH